MCQLFKKTQVEFEKNSTSNKMKDLFPYLPSFKDI